MQVSSNQPSCNAIMQHDKNLFHTTNICDLPSNMSSSGSMLFTFGSRSCVNCSASDDIMSCECESIAETHQYEYNIILEVRKLIMVHTGNRES